MPLTTIWVLKGLPTAIMSMEITVDLAEQALGIKDGLFETMG